MPPRDNVAKRLSAPSTSKDLVPGGPRHVAGNARHGGRNEGRKRPTTSRALILRNGKYGARGTGELMLMNKLSGREKLDLLAEDLVKQSKNAIMNPFRLERCLKIAESQYHVFLDDIVSLRDPDLFCDKIKAELSARTPQGAKKDLKKPDPLQNPSYIASVIATRIHNAYLLASAWRLVLNNLKGLMQEGLSDDIVKSQLKKNTELRSHYLVLYDMVGVLVNMSQAKFSVLATTTPHYSRYFKPAESLEPGDQEMVFDWAELREACVSFLDSIIIELCFPRAPYPKAVLYQILHDVIEESPREEKRFPQALWDAAGDLSESVALQEILEAPLFGLEGEAWKGSPREIPEEYEHWFDAQGHSEKASGQYANYKDIIYPLEKTKNKVVLDNMWKYVNLNYRSFSGVDIDTLWRLEGATDPTPTWHAFYLPDFAEDPDDEFDGGEGTPLKAKKKCKHLAITDGNDSNSSMPELQSASNSSESESDETGTEGESDDDESDGDSDYDTEQEDEMREMLREAMDMAHEAGWFDLANPPEINPLLQEDRKGNPFLKLLGSLRGRVFSSNPKLRVGSLPERPAPTGPYTPRAGTQGPAAEKPSNTHQPTIEELEDKDADSAVPKKKKPKKKKKKRPAHSGSTTSPSSVALGPPIPAKPTVLVLPSPTKPGPAPKPVTLSQSNVFGNIPPQMSTTSLSLPTEPSIAQSARSYIQAESLDVQKSKIKSRPDHASLFSDTPGKKGFLSKLGMGRNKDKVKDEAHKGAKHSWFARLSKKTRGYMHQLLNTSEDETKGMAPMKWEHFLKIMREMGFEYDPSTAGSSVRFDPPDKKDKSITIHRPHPDPTIQPIKLKDISKRLQKYYGWTEEDFVRHI